MLKATDIPTWSWRYFRKRNLSNGYLARDGSQHQATPPIKDEIELEWTLPSGYPARLACPVMSSLGSPVPLPTRIQQEAKTKGEDLQQNEGGERTKRLTRVQTSLVGQHQLVALGLNAPLCPFRSFLSLSRRAFLLVLYRDAHSLPITRAAQLVLVRR